MASRGARRTRTQRGSARRLLLINAGTGTIAAIALGIDATSGVPGVLTVFGVRAVVSGGAQLVVVRSSATTGRCCSPTGCQ